MKINQIECSLLEYPLPAPLRPSWAPGRVFTTTNCTLLRVHTDEGISGIGAGPEVGMLGIHTFADLVAPYILGKDPVSVSATGRSHFQSRQADIAYLTLFYEDDFIAHISVSWCSPVKDRTVLLGGDRGVALFDDAENLEKLRVYEVGYETKAKPGSPVPQIICSSGAARAGEPDTCNALKNVCAEFLRCIEEHDEPESGGDFGLGVMRVLEAADASLRDNGREVFIKY